MRPTDYHSLQKRQHVRYGPSLVCSESVSPPTDRIPLETRIIVIKNHTQEDPRGRTDGVAYSKTTLESDTLSLHCEHRHVPTAYALVPTRKPNTTVELGELRERWQGPRHSRHLMAKKMSIGLARVPCGCGREGGTRARV